MKKDTITITDMKNNLPSVLEIVDKKGKIVISENNKAKYILAKVDEPFIELTDNEMLEVVAKRILNEHIKAFKELAK